MNYKALISIVDVIVMQGQNSYFESQSQVLFNNKIFSPLAKVLNTFFHDESAKNLMSISCDPEDILSKHYI